MNSAPFTIPRVKICGLDRPKDAAAAAAAGALYVGAVLVADSPRAVSPARARRLHQAAGLPLVVVVANRPPDEVAALADRAGASVIQLHGDETEDDLGALRDLGEWELWKAHRVRSADDLLPAAERWAAVADGLLLDGWDPSQLGGTGTRFPWEALEAVRLEWPDSLSLIVAGGLSAANVGEAIRRLRPNVVDVSSGVEHQPGVKDHTRIRDFIDAVRAAGPDLQGESR